MPIFLLLLPRGTLFIEAYTVDVTRWTLNKILKLHQVLLDIGGTHHAFRDRGEGFCVFNDIAVAARNVMEEIGIERILVVDLDVHQVKLSILQILDCHHCTCTYPAYTRRCGVKVGVIPTLGSCVIQCMTISGGWAKACFLVHGCFGDILLIGVD